MDDQTHARVGDYEILGVLGAGGMGKVYKVRNVISDRVEAMKILLPDLADRRALADRFLREIKLLATLNHPNIATLRTALTWDNQLVMIMEYVEGITLSALLRRGPIAPMQAVDYISQVLSALAYAHSLHIIHRDIKPANMMLTQQGVVKLMDFGIARSQGDPVLTQSGSTLGSLQYMSPEQVRGEPADERSDLYSIGVSLYELTTGQRPFRADNEYAVMLAHLQTPPPPPIDLRPDMPPVLNDIILMAMAKDPAQRFQSATAMRNALQSVGLASAGLAAQPASPLPDAPVPPLGDAANAARADEATGECASPPSAVIRAAMQGSDDNRTPLSAPAQVSPEAIPRPAAVAPTPIPVTAPSAQPDVIAQPQAPSSSHAPVAQATPPIEPSQAQVRNLPPWQAGTAAPNLAPQPSPVLVPPKPDMPSPVPTNRGLYVALGSVIVLVVLVVAGLYIPRMSRAHAGGDATTLQRPAKPSPPPVMSNTEPSPAQSVAANSMPAVPAVPEVHPPSSAETRQPPSYNDNGVQRPSPPADGASTRKSEHPSSANHTYHPAPSANRGNTHEQALNSPTPDVPAPPPANSEQFQQLEHDADLLAGRAEAVDASLEGLRQNQAAQGLGLRGDVASSQQRMRTYMARAQSALKNRDPEGAKKYLGLADTEITNLEKFLGH